MEKFKIDDIAYNHETTSVVFNKMNKLELVSEIAPSKTGEYLFDELVKSDKLSAFDIISFALGEDRMGRLIVAMNEEFKEYVVAERSYG